MSPPLPSQIRLTCGFSQSRSAERAKILWATGKADEIRAEHEKKQEEVNRAKSERTTGHRWRGGRVRLSPEEKAKRMAARKARIDQRLRRERIGQRMRRLADDERENQAPRA